MHTHSTRASFFPRIFKQTRDGSALCSVPHIQRTSHIAYHRGRIGAYARLAPSYTGGSKSFHAAWPAGYITIIHLFIYRASLLCRLRSASVSASTLPQPPSALCPLRSFVFMIGITKRRARARARALATRARPISICGPSGGAHLILARPSGRLCSCSVADTPSCAVRPCRGAAHATQHAQARGRLRSPQRNTERAH